MPTIAVSSGTLGQPTVKQVGKRAVAGARRPLGILALACCLLPWTAHAAGVRWTYPDGGFWDDAANWTGGVLPGPDDDAFIGTLGSGGIEVRQLPGTPALPLSQYVVGTLLVRSPFTHAGGSLHVKGNATFLDSFTWSGGYAHVLDTIDSGTWTFARGIRLTSPEFVGASRGTWRLEGESVVDAGAAGFLFNPGATVEIVTGARLDVRDGSQLTFLGGLTIAGTLDRTASSGTIALFARGGANEGFVRNRVGTLTYEHAGATHSGDFQVDQDARLTFAGGQRFTGAFLGAGDVGFDRNEDFHVDATKFQNTGELRITRGARLHWTGDGTIASIADAGGTLLPTGYTTVTGPVRGAGLFVQGTADSVARFASGLDLSVTFNVLSGTVELGGTTRLSGRQQTLAPSGSGAIILLSGARLELTADDGESFAGVQGSTLVNRGTIVRDGGGTQSFRSSAFTNEGSLSVLRGGLADGSNGASTTNLLFTNRGLITVAADTFLLHRQADLVQEAGELHVDGVATFNDIRIGGGTVRGSGVLRTAGGTGRVENAGTIAPGNSAGTLTVDGDYVQQDGGRLVMELGVDSDQFVVTGQASFAGVLEIVFVSGFVPTLGERFDLIRYHTHSGTLALVTKGEAARAGYTYDLDFGAEGALLTVTGLAPPVPEPASIALVAAGLGLIGAVRRRMRGR